MITSIEIFFQLKADQNKIKIKKSIGKQQIENYFNFSTNLNMGVFRGGFRVQTLKINAFLL